MQSNMVKALTCGMVTAVAAAGSIWVVPNVAIGFGVVSVISYGVGSCLSTSRSAKIAACVASLFSTTGTIAAIISSVQGSDASCTNSQVVTREVSSVTGNECVVETVPERVVLIAVAVCSFALSAVFSLLSVELQRRSERRRSIEVIV